MYTEYKKILLQALNDMDIPPTRKTKADFENLCWLKNNLKYTNASHRNYNLVKNLVSILLSYE